ncbi:MAG: hypothetical protein ACK4RV_10110 [Caulobacter sp.]
MTWIALALSLIRRFWWVILAVAAAIVFASLIGRWNAEKRALEAVRQKAGGYAAEGQANASQGALKTLDELADQKAANDTLTKEHADAIHKAPNARDDAGAAGDAGLAGMCERPSYRDRPRCVELRRARSGQPSR